MHLLILEAFHIRATRATRKRLRGEVNNIALRSGNIITNAVKQLSGLPSPANGIARQARMLLMNSVTRDQSEYSMHGLRLVEAYITLHCGPDNVTPLSHSTCVPGILILSVFPSRKASALVHPSGIVMTP